MGFAFILFVLWIEIMESICWKKIKNNLRIKKKTKNVVIGYTPSLNTFSGGRDFSRL